jgi:hypothetical protein
MKRVFLYAIVLMAFMVGAASAATLKWDPSANTDEPGMQDVTYVIWEGLDLAKMAEVDQTTEVSWKIPDDVVHGVFYQVHAYNVNGASDRSNHVQYLNKDIPMVPGDPHIEDDETVGVNWPYKHRKHEGHNTPVWKHKKRQNEGR